MMPILVKNSWVSSHTLFNLGDNSNKGRLERHLLSLDLCLGFFIGWKVREESFILLLGGEERSNDKSNDNDNGSKQLAKKPILLSVSLKPSIGTIESLSEIVRR